MMALIPERWADRTNGFAVGLIAAGLPLSRILMSVGIILLVLEWFFGGNIKERAKRAFKDPAVLWLLAFFAIHLLGLLHTSELKEGLQDIRIKLPLLLLPITLGGRENTPPFRPILLVFMAAFFLSSASSFLVWMDWLRIPWEIRGEPTLFISAIRLSLMGCMALFFSFLLFREETRPVHKLLSIAFILWTLFYLAILATGISMVVVLALLLHLFYRWWKKERKVAPLLIILGTLIAPSAYLVWEWQDYAHIEDSPLNKNEDLPPKTAQGIYYEHYPEKKASENGYYVWRYICRPELKKAWNERSDIPYKGKDGKGNAIEYTLIRYMTSKGLKKDAEGMEKMSPADIRRVEEGVANIALHRMNPLRKRLRKAMFAIDQYRRGQNPSGNSLTQRFEFWRAGSWIIREHPWIGVGTGDLDKAFEEAYHEIDTPLKPEYRERAHQQFLTCWIAWGPLGFLLFLASLFVPGVRKKAFQNPYYTVFFITIFLSFFTEDTLGTQAGVTLYAFWNAFFLFQARSRPS